MNLKNALTAGILGLSSCMAPKTPDNGDIEGRISNCKNDVSAALNNLNAQISEEFNPFEQRALEKCDYEILPQMPNNPQLAELYTTMLTKQRKSCPDKNSTCMDTIERMHLSPNQRLQVCVTKNDKVVVTVRGTDQSFISIPVVRAYKNSHHEGTIRGAKSWLYYRDAVKEIAR